TRFSRDWSSDVCSSDLSARWHLGTPAVVSADGAPQGRYGGISGRGWWRRPLHFTVPTMTVSLETIANLAKRRGFVFQSSEIYGRSEERRVGTLADLVGS